MDFLPLDLPSRVLESTVTLNKLVMDARPCLVLKTRRATHAQKSSLLRARIRKMMTGWIVTRRVRDNADADAPGSACAAPIRYRTHVSRCELKALRAFG